MSAANARAALGSAASPSPALEAQGLSVTLGANRVLSDVSFEALSGSWTTLVGPNGAGKSVLLRALAGLIDTEGKVRVGSQELGGWSVRRRALEIAYVPQRPARPDAMSVSDYVMLGRTPHIRPLASEAGTDWEIVVETLERLDLSRLAKRMLETLSGGELQRANLARAIAQRTCLLILDEPTTALDIGHTQQALELIDELRSERTLTVITAMHGLNAAAQYSDRLVLLASGEVIASGEPAEVLTKERVSEVYAASVDVSHIQKPSTNGQATVLVEMRRPSRAAQSTVQSTVHTTEQSSRR